MQIVFYARVVKEEHREAVSHLLSLFAPKCKKIFLFTSLYELAKDNLSTWKDVFELIEEENLFHQKIDYAVAIGGDGSFLDMATKVAPHQIPVLGVNFGRLGFLTDISIQDAEKIVHKLLKKEYFTEERSMLNIESNQALSCFANKNFAINEITLSRKDTSTLISLEMSVDRRHVHTYWADGIIISTPTGSTGYNLSCNGPIVFPKTPCLIITPYASHNLNVRPLVLPENVTLHFKISCRTSQHFICMLDSRRQEIDISHCLTIKKNKFPVIMIKTNQYDFVDALIEKLHWGLDLRNK